MGSVQAEPEKLLSSKQSTLRLTAADFLMTQESLPPLITTGWQSLSLPDNWNVRHPGQGGNGWYRLHFFVDQVPETIQAIHIAHASVNATVFLNGELIDNSGELLDSGERHWNRPILIKFLPHHLVLGSNQLMIRVDASASLSEILCARHNIPPKEFSCLANPRQPQRAAKRPCRNSVNKCSNSSSLVR
jgi:hypothetical protein